METQYITSSMDFSCGKGVVRGRRRQQLEFTLICPGTLCAATAGDCLPLLGVCLRTIFPYNSVSLGEHFQYFPVFVWNNPPVKRDYLI